jgi:predicted nucleic acid-binding protein
MPTSRNKRRPLNQFFYDAVLDALESMLSIPNLHVYDQNQVKAAIGLAKSKKQSYPDAYIAAVAMDNDIGVVSFNVKHFSKLNVQVYPIDAEMSPKKL